MHWLGWDSVKEERVGKRNIRISIPLILCLWLQTNRAFSQQTIRDDSDSISISTSRSTGDFAESKFPAEGHLKMSLSGDSVQYLSSQAKFFDRGTETPAHLSSLTLQIDYSWRGLFDGAISLKDRVAIQEGSNYFMPRDLYGGWQGQGWKFWLGRKWYLWSEADEHFHRGLFQGRFMNDKFRQDSHGLTGLFFEKNWEGTQLVVFASPLYIPEFGPDHKIVDGGFESPNPFFRPPSRFVDFLGVETRLRYKLIYPVESEIVLNQSYGALFETHQGPFYFRSSYAYKPMNQLLVGAQFYFRHSERGDQDISVNVFPRLQYHHLAAVEGGFSERGGWTTWLSLVNERPEKDNVPVDWTYQDTGPSSVLTFYLGRDLGVSPLGETRLFFSTSKIYGGDRHDGGEFTARETLFERRFQFYDVLSFGLQGGNTRLLKHKLSWNTRLDFDESQRGVLWLSDVHYKFDKDWTLWTSLDLIGILDSGKARITDGFLGEYRANDRAQLGVQYVF